MSSSAQLPCIFDVTLAANLSSACLARCIFGVHIARIFDQVTEFGKCAIFILFEPLGVKIQQRLSQIEAQINIVLIFYECIT